MSRWLIFLGALACSCGARTGLLSDGTGSLLPPGGTHVSACPPGFAACNSSSPTACEVEIAADNSNCGSCGHACAEGFVCGAGQCVPPATIVQIGLGAYFSCARTASGKVFCWGANEHGQLGNGTLTASNQPVPVREIADAIEVSVGPTAACARRRSGTVMCWGEKTLGQLAGDASDSNLPIQVTGLVPEALARIVMGATAACAIQRDGTALCWGDNECGDLGDGSFIGRSDPKPVLDLSSARTLTILVVGCATLSSGGVACWGANGSGALGDGSDPFPDRTFGCGRTPRSRPGPVQGITDATDVIVGGFGAVCATRASRLVSCWGNGQERQLAGDGSGGSRSTPIQVAGISDAVQVGIGLYHACARRRSGEIACWGNDTSDAQGADWIGLFGTGGIYTGPQPARTAGITTATSLAVGAGHSCALLADGAVRCWGLNRFGELGDSTTITRTSPVAVIGLP